jgi:hypothetical protein
MPPDLFDRLSASPVPPPPAELDRGVHERVNRALLVGHLVDFALGAIPFAMRHFAAAVGGLIVLTVTGRFPAGPKNVRSHESAPQ